MSLFVAIMVATGFAVFGFPFRFYRCWFSWSPLGANAGVLLYLVLAGGGGGLLGWMVAYLAQVPPSPVAAIDGFFYGVAGALAVRADFRGQRPRTPREVQTAASLLGKGIEWCTGMLHDLTQERTKRWLNSLDDFTLLKVSNDLIQEINARVDLAARAKTSMVKGQVEAMRKLAAGSIADDGERAGTRGQLVYFCLNYMLGEHHIRPVYDLPARPMATQATDP